MAPFGVYANSLILMDYKNGTDELLFQTENQKIKWLDDIVTYYEYFDIEVQDVDGNGEGDWLYEVINPLREMGEENRKIDVFLDDIKQHFRNGITESERPEDNVDNAGRQLETYIASKEKQMSEWTFYNSRYFNQELLWENYVYDDSYHVKKLKIYKEHGERGDTMHQLALYLYDYTTGEIEKQSVSGVFAKVVEERQLEFKDVELKNVLYEDINSDGIPDIKMTAACIIEDSVGWETEELYEITYCYQADNGEFVSEETDSAR